DVSDPHPWPGWSPRLPSGGRSRPGCSVYYHASGRVRHEQDPHRQPGERHRGEHGRRACPVRQLPLHLRIGVHSVSYGVRHHEHTVASPILKRNPAQDLAMPKPVAIPPPGFDELTVDEQIDYVQSLWDRIAATPDQVPVPGWHREVLAERLKDSEKNPDAGESW